MPTLPTAKEYFGEKSDKNLCFCNNFKFESTLISQVKLEIDDFRVLKKKKSNFRHRKKS